MPANIESTIQELTLLTLYLTSWREQHYPERRAWKGYTFEALDALSQDGYISTRKGDKSVLFSNEGVAEARRLLEKYGITDPEAGE